MVHLDSDSVHTITPIESWLRSLSFKKNIQVIAFLDCCRKVITLPEPDTKGSVDKFGEIYIGFGCRLDKLAVCTPEGGSQFTNDVIEWVFKTVP